uniref:Uncharacterized protein n=1 Tax=Globisporangium ultimum (strain ATCC 200006 / CBS 805.95 / DAOM BR144) TaxID=431595 RepID=K3X3E6_GLOUD
MAHFGAAQLPALTTSVGDLYGASSYRMGETQEYALDLDELDREELALEHMVQALVERKAPLPIGVKFHRAIEQELPGAGGGVQSGGRLALGARRGEAMQAREGIEDDDDEEDGEDEEDEMEEDEMDDDDDVFAAEEHELDDDAADSGDDPFAREEGDSLDDVSMEMDVEPPPSTW